MFGCSSLPCVKVKAELIARAAIINGKKTEGKNYLPVDLLIRDALNPLPTATPTWGIAENGFVERAGPQRVSIFRERDQHLPPPKYDFRDTNYFMLVIFKE